MKAHSLRLRLVLVSSVSIFVVLSLSALGLIRLFERNIERSLDSDLSNYIQQLAGHLEFTADGTPRLSSDPTNPRFQQPLSGLYWQVQDLDTGTLLRSRSLWDYVLPLPNDKLKPGAIHDHTLPGPGGTRLRARERPIVFADGDSARTLRISAAADTRAVQRSVDDFVDDLVPAVATLAIVLSLAAAIQVWFGLRPLGAVKDGIAEVRSRRQNRLSGSFPTEIQPLVAELNELLEAQDRAMEQARHRAADLAHGLKTPLTVLFNDAHKLRQRGESELADEIESLATSMRGHIDHELARARTAAQFVSMRPHADLVSTVNAVLATLQRTPAGEHLRWMLRLPEQATVAVNANDLADMVGNLLENASKWATATVVVELTADNDSLLLEILDDGPGVVPAQLKTLGQRGLRLDEKTPGTGMGLAIVGEMLSTYGGSLQLENRDQGGLRVQLRLPGVR